MKLNKPIRPATGELWLYYLHDANKTASQLLCSYIYKVREKKNALSASENARDL
jgi:hypothetical protein